MVLAYSLKGVSRCYQCGASKKGRVYMKLCFLRQDAISRFTAELSHRRTAAAFVSWRQAADDGAARRRRMLRAVERLAALRTSTAFMAWRDAVLERLHLRALLTKGVK